MTREVQLEFDFRPPTRNAYKARCYRCGGDVAAHEGILSFEGFPGQRWSRAATQRNWRLVEHDACAARYAGTNIHFTLEPDNG